MQHDTALARFLAQAKQQPETVAFNDTMAIIDALYQHTPAAFRVGQQRNAAGQNNGSSKILAFARMHGLDAPTALQLFGDYYRKDVLAHPEGEDHANIRQFQQYGWAEVEFEQEVLTPR